MDAVNAKSESNNFPGCLNLGPEDQIVQINKFGTFVFPISFRTFESSLNKIVVFDKLTKNREHCLMLLGNDEYCRSTLKNFYYRYYMFPRFRGKTNYFKELPPTPLAKLLEFGRPYDNMAAKTVLELDAKKSNNINFIVSFDQFKRSLRNLDEIVENLKLVDKNYAGKDHEECAHDYYMAFYLTPEIRQKYKFKLRPCATDFQDRLLALPSNKWSTN
ncbi:protein telomere ends associated-like isoform X1 [Drosophila ficusphila]|uniref:protein telomere ends associated-like isoform X1 n=1 Tax=Drosophila ficusphila TaxID=30025 RepID=UPI0007E69034|nr:protein telomere ends associated-like isoform X1 [Drosophila ficusphila]